MTYKIALSGSHGTGKTQIIGELRQRLTAEHFTSTVVESPSRFVKSLGFNLNQGGDWKTQLLSVTHRMTRQIEALQANVDFILADRWVLDEMAYTAYHQLTQEGELDPIVQPLFNNLFGPVQTISSQFIADDVKDYWDLLFFKPAHPDFPPEADGDRDGALEFQKAIEGQFVRLIEDYGLTDNVGVLDEDLYAAVDQIWLDPKFVEAREKSWG